jgi:hypothetical protein
LVHLPVSQRASYRGLHKLFDGLADVRLLHKVVKLMGAVYKVNSQALRVCSNWFR